MIGHEVLKQIFKLNKKTLISSSNNCCPLQLINPHEVSQMCDMHLIILSSFSNEHIELVLNTNTT